MSLKRFDTEDRIANRTEMLTEIPSDKALANWRRCHTLVVGVSDPTILRRETMGFHNLAVSGTAGWVGSCA